MQDKLLLLVGNWFAIEAEGASAILAACFISGCFGILSIFVLSARTRRVTTFHQSELNVTATDNTYKIDQPK